MLPTNTPLHYDYEGSRQELAGVRFTILNQHGMVMIVDYRSSKGGA